MKRKVLSSLLTIACVISLFACGSKTEISEVTSTDVTESGTEEVGGISENGGVLTKVISYEGEWETVKYNILYTYDENGNRESMVYYLPDGGIGCEIVYDSDGNILKNVLYDEDGKEYDRTESEYVNGNMVKNTEYILGSITDVFEYEYDQDGGKIKTVGTNADGDTWIVSEGECDGNGNTIAEQFYDLNGEKLSYSEYKYDSNGNLLESKSTNSDGTSYGSTEYEYDQYGNKIKIISYNGDGTLAGTDEYEYEYDAKGNIIKSTHYYNGEITQYNEYTANGTETKTMYMGDNGLYTTLEAECDSDGNILKEYWYDLDGEVYATAEYIYE